MQFNGIILLAIFLLINQIVYAQEVNKIFYTESSGGLNKTDYFLRKLIAEEEGKYRVQDFYSSGNKKTCPYILLDKDELNQPNAKSIDGYYTVFDSEGNQKATAYYKRGTLLSPIINFYGTGVKRTESYEYNGQLEGPFTAWYHNGIKKLSGTFSEGKQIGIFTYWDKDGNKTEEIYWKSPGELSKKLEFDKQGNIIKETKFEDKSTQIVDN